MEFLVLGILESLVIGFLGKDGKERMNLSLINCTTMTGPGVMSKSDQRDKSNEYLKDKSNSL